MTGGYLDLQIRQRVIRPIIAFRDYIFRYVVPQFAKLDERAEQIGNDYYEEAVSQPAGEDFDGDLSGFAEDAHDHALGWYEMMRSLRQSMLNLLAAGLFHLIEQQLAELCCDAGFGIGPPRDTNLGVVAEWYQLNLRLDLHLLSSWTLIDELRLVANTTKHAEGKSSRDLRKLRPQLFCDPTFAKAFEGMGIRDYFENRAISAPLAGEDLFVTEDLLKMYAECAELFFREIAGHFAAHEDEAY
jgi:hypothetical protein